MQKVKSSLQQIGFNRNSKIQQMVIGSVAGFATGYLTMKVGKKVAFLVGGGIILFQVAQNQGLTKATWQDAHSQYQSFSQKLQASSGSWKEKAKDYAKNNTCFAASFIGGFLIGASCRH
ncbi:hypothetical protein Trydic_g18098 [Trypoxylus dichotomus]